jgi:hypothetical protein
VIIVALGEGCLFLNCLVFKASKLDLEEQCKFFRGDILRLVPNYCLDRRLELRIKDELVEMALRRDRHITTCNMDAVSCGPDWKLIS